MTPNVKNRSRATLGILSPFKIVELRRAVADRRKCFKLRNQSERLTGVTFLSNTICTLGGKFAKSLNLFWYQFDF